MEHYFKAICCRCTQVIIYPKRAFLNSSNMPRYDVHSQCQKEKDLALTNNRSSSDHLLPLEIVKSMHPSYSATLHCCTTERITYSSFTSEVSQLGGRWIKEHRLRNGSTFVATFQLSAQTNGSDTRYRMMRSM